MTTFRLKTAIIFGLFLLLSTSCMKDFLDIKRDKSQVIPVTLTDYFSIFENNNMNYNSAHLLGEIASDDYFIEAGQWRALSDPVQRNAYVWASEIFEGESSVDWNRAYEKILYANFVMEGVDSIGETVANKTFRDELLGGAHFHRGTNFFNLAQLFCKQYNQETANTDLGLPLRTTSNINDTYPRSTLEETYNQILNDLSVAIRLLPVIAPVNTRPSKAAAIGMMAKVHLQLGDYELAYDYADKALEIHPEVLNYNDIDTSANIPFPLYGQGNPEIIYYTHTGNATAILSNARLSVDSLLFDSYHKDDLRKGAFFFPDNGRNGFKGHYSGSTSFLFSGLTTPELLLIRAECAARLGNRERAAKDLNTLLSNRFTPGDFVPIELSVTSNELLQLVLSERRKELVYRGVRWHDLLRFHSGPAFAKPLTRMLDGIEYSLPVGSPRWVWPVPPDVIALSGIQKNQRD